jgi:hypothetical protein
MAPSSKAADNRRKSGGKPSLIVKLAVAPARLQELFDSSTPEEESPVTESKPSDESPVDSGTVNATGDNASDSNAATPVPEGTPVPSSMGPPTDTLKKKGVKRSAPATNNDGIPKPRGKPGPKKKPRLEDGTIDHAGAKAGAGHKLGPKANMGAINAGLRALDRSGKPCRKWAKGGFRLKSFTGVCWELPRWTAPPKKTIDPSTDDSNVPSADNSSSKENKENGEANGEAGSGENSNLGAEGEAHSAPSIGASSPAPITVAAAS